MDLGATLCTRSNPSCAACPLTSRCAARKAGTVNELPTPKPKKTKPVQAARFFVLTAPNKAVLVEQKPLDGLWGGLWTPPQRPRATSARAFLTELGIQPDEIGREHVAPIFRHTFSHYHLDIEPVYLHLDRAPVMVLDRHDHRWIFPEQIGDNAPIGLSKPAVTLLQSLLEPFAT